MRNQTGENNPNWKGGRFHASNGYIWVYKPDHPFANKVAPKGYVAEHRLVMEQKIGRYLTKKEVVHHINSIRDDNREENLMLTTTGHNVAISNSTRSVTQQYKEKRKENAKRFIRDKLGKFIKI